MFKTIGNTFDLMKASWRVLQMDKELLLFPIMSAAALIVFLLIGLGVYSGIGGLDRLESETYTAGDIALGLAFYGGASFIIIFFNAALVAAARERLRGGSPTVRFGLRASWRHKGTILAWALIAATVGLILDMFRSDDSLIGRVIGYILSAIWGFMTFLVVPVLVAEGVGPIEAMSRSTALLKKTWGQQVVSNFGFTLAYIVVIIAAVIPVAIGAAIDPLLAIVLGALISLPIVAVGFAAIMAMEGIFRAALYQFAAEGSASDYFPEGILRNAYVGKEDRGGWGSGGSTWGGGAGAPTYDYDHPSRTPPSV